LRKKKPSVKPIKEEEEAAWKNCVKTLYEAS